MRLAIHSNSVGVFLVRNTGRNFQKPYFWQTGTLKLFILPKTQIMKLLARILLSAIAVFVIAELLPGIDVENFTTAVIVAVVLGFFNAIIRPLLILLTLPVTILTFGLFLLVINVVIILLVDSLVGGFVVAGFWSALFFSLLLSFLESFLFSLLKDSDK